MCVGCHRAKLHRRFNSPRGWSELLDRHAIPADHWARLVSAEPFDLAALIRSRGGSEPRWQSFLARG